MNKVWIEAALNGPWGRERQPGIPMTVDEIVADGLAAADAGAAIIHLHAYDPATGRQKDEWETYARIIEGIKAKADVIVYPTIPLAGSDYASVTRSVGSRIRRSLQNAACLNGPSVIRVRAISCVSTR